MITMSLLILPKSFNVSPDLRRNVCFPPIYAVPLAQSFSN